MKGAKAALDAAVAEARREEIARLPAQLGLFEEEASAQPGAPGANGAAVARRGPGRPPGARGRRTEEASRFYLAEFGDPLRRGVQVSALPILNDGVLDQLAAAIGAPNRFEAAKFWLSTYTNTMPYLHQKFSTVEVKPPGSPEGSEPLIWGFVEALEADAEEVAAAVDQTPGNSETEG